MIVGCRKCCREVAGAFVLLAPALPFRDESEHQFEPVGLSGLGCRIGELLALDWTRVDDRAATLAIEGTVIRVPAEGLIVQPHTKSGASMRTITPPVWLMELLVTRHSASHGPWVFPSTAGTLRDPDNTRKQLRQAVAGTEWQGLHPHVFRHLVATRLDAEGLSAREIADYLGHERVSMTQDVYMSRRVVGAGASVALDRFGPAATPSTERRL